MNCSASSPLLMPPMPRIGSSAGGPGGLARRTARRPDVSAGPDSPPVMPPRTGAILSVSIAMPSKGVDERQPVGSGVRARAGDNGDVGDVRRKLRQDRNPVRSRAPDRTDHPGGRGGVASEHLAPILHVRAGDVHLDHRHRRMAGDALGQGDVFVGVPAGNRHHNPGSTLGQPGQVVGDERGRCLGLAARSSSAFRSVSPPSAASTVRTGAEP